MKSGIVPIAAALAIGWSAASHAGSYSNDFSTDVGAASLRGTAVLDAGSVRLTPDDFDQEGSLVLNNLDPGLVVQTFDASFTIAIGPGSDPIADGVSFSLGFPPVSTYGESGTPFGLVVIFDTYDNGESPTPPVIRIVVNGTQVAAQQVTLDSGGAFRPVTIHYDSGGLDVDYNSGAIVFTDVALPGFVPDLNSRFTFGARTGGSTSEQRIDDVSITTTAVAPPPALNIQPVPTLDEWGVISMAALLALLGAFTLRRRHGLR